MTRSLESRQWMSDAISTRLLRWTSEHISFKCSQTTRCGAEQLACAADDQASTADKHNRAWEINTTHVAYTLPSTPMLANFVSAPPAQYLAEGDEGNWKSGGWKCCTLSLFTVPSSVCCRAGRNSGKCISATAANTSSAVTVLRRRWRQNSCALGGDAQR